MPNRILDPLWQDMVRELRLRRPCYVAIFGPPGAGKTDLLIGIEERCKTETEISVISLRLDLRNFLLDDPPLMFAALVSDLHATASRSGMVSKWCGKTRADASDLDGLVSHWLGSTPACVLLTIDHLDAAPRSLVRVLLRALRFFNDQSAAHAEYSRFGAVIAGAASIYEMREELYSMLVRSTFVALPTADKLIREELVSDYLEEKQIAGGRAVVELLALWTGGERSHLEPLLHHIFKSVNGQRLTEGKVLACLRTLKLEDISPGVRDLGLWLAADDDLQVHVRRLLSSDGLIPAQRIAFDLDIFQVYGAFIRISARGADTYIPRNLLVQSFLRRVVQHLDGPGSNLSADLAHDIRKYSSAKFAIRKTSRLDEAAPALWSVWKLLTGHAPVDLFFLARPAGTEGGYCFRYGGGELHTFELPPNETITTLLAQPAETMGEWVAADANHMFAVSTQSRERSELRIVARITKIERKYFFSEVALGHWFRLLSSVNEALQNLVASEIGWCAIKSPEVIKAVSDKNKVFVVHGRNQKVRNAMFSFLRSIGLQPLEWSLVVAATGKGSPTIDEILKKGFDMAQAAVVLMTGDDEAKLRDEYVSASDKTVEGVLQPQARPNVLYEAGMAMGRYPDRTILVEVPPLRPFTDIAGMHTIRIENSIQSRQELANRLQTAGCAVELRGLSWHNEGDFTSPRTRKAKSAAK